MQINLRDLNYWFTLHHSKINILSFLVIKFIQEKGLEPD
jgi:hypothetical protein